ncbi:hypothetical protein M9Y10_032770 [Tritrichomonas musculus]|uniref:Small GTP-binding protein n=1 Tax=Tritrichomonas musculus TaxID=1915356 RepID=A0ABR2GYM7_9EUKA
MQMVTSFMKHKIVMIGDSLVGKTSLMHRLTRDVFMPSCQPTVGTGCATWSTTLGKDPTYLQIWDTAGQERYRSLGGIFYQNAEAAIVVFSKTDIESAKNVKSWVEQFRAVMGTSPFIAIVQNKSDIDYSCQISDESSEEIDIEKWAKEKGFFYIETSAKTGKNVQELFIAVTQSVVQKLEVPSKLLFQPTALLAVKNAQKTVNQCC